VTSANGTNVGTTVSEFSSVDSSRLEGGLVYTDSTALTVSNSYLKDVSMTCGESSFSVSNSRLVNDAVYDGPGCSQSYSDDRFIGSGSGVAVYVGGGWPTHITGSVFTGWDIAVQVTEFSTPDSFISGNTFRHNRIGVMSCTTGSSCPDSGFPVSANRFVGNTGTGLVLTEGTWHVGSNTFLHNGGLGIDAEGSQLTVIDDGNNIARHNQPPQCIGVVCTP
jgi:hypothetical protein